MLIFIFGVAFLCFLGGLFIGLIFSLLFKGVDDLISEKGKGATRSLESWVALFQLPSLFIAFYFTKVSLPSNIVYGDLNEFYATSFFSGILLMLVKPIVAIVFVLLYKQKS